MKVLATIVCFSISLSLAAQTMHRASSRARTKAKPDLATVAVAPAWTDVNGSLVRLEQVRAATEGDIAGLEIDKWKSGWKTVWLKRSSRKEQAEGLAASLHRNLTEAMPGLIRDAQNSQGGIGATFKLYNNVNVVYESLESLVEVTNSYGKKGESSQISADYAALGRLRQELSGYIQLTAATLEPKPVALPKKIVIDDNVPSHKKTASLQAPQQ
ncbi:MAG TPA: hypothetical protein VIX19_18260 [Terriglobales bacterium]